VVKGVLMYPVLAPGMETENWLSSDVVRVGGVPADTAYAIQMTFDERINQSFDGSAANPDNNKIVTLDAGSQAGWTNVAHVGVQHRDESLQVFITAQIAADEGWTFEDSLGAWGVDKASGKAWAIVKGGTGVFAVVPEPATIVMMLSATLGAMAYGFRRWSRKSQVSA
jgi:hypothetical protein